jgi:ABC-type bacteriocin/lantibiotic exporter with double-glycine peptidase domain
MVLGSFGLEMSESELRARCDTTPIYGTDALLAVDVARALGFSRTGKYTFTFEELKTLVEDGHYPIAFVDLNPIDGVDDIHTLVVIGISQEEVTVLDPLQGERRIPDYVFTAGWVRRHNLVILVER